MNRRVCSLNRAKDGFGKQSDSAKAVVPLKHAVNAFEELAVQTSLLLAFAICLSLVPCLDCSIVSYSIGKFFSLPL